MNPTVQKSALISLILLPGTLLLAESLTLISVASFIAQPAQAADFAHAKQTIVPNSRIRRRYDSEMRESSPYSSNPAPYGTYDDPNAGMSAPYSLVTPSYPSGSSSSKPSKNGLIPPPPAMTPSIVGPNLGAVPSPQSAAHPNVGFQSFDTAQPSLISQKASSQVDTFLREGKFAEAQAVIKSYTKAYPKDKALKAHLAQTLLANGKKFAASKDLENAVKTAREALILEPNSTVATASLNDWLKRKGVEHTNHLERLKMADGLAREGKNNEALVEYRAAHKLKPTAEAHVGAGSMLAKEGKRESARSEFQQALDLEPNSGPALRHMGSIRYTQGDVVGANADLSRALIINPDDKVAARTLTDLWHRQIAKSPRDASAHLGLARAYQLSGDLKSSQNEYKQVVRLEPDNPNLPAARQSFKLALARQEALKAYDAAQTLDSSGALREAHSKIVEAVGIAPTDVKIRLYEGDLSSRLGMYPQAHEAYMTVLREDPKNLVAAKKLQELAAKNSANSSFSGQSAPQAQGMASPPALGLLSQLGSPSVLPGELPPAPTLPQPSDALAQAAAEAGQMSPASAALPSDSHVNSFSGFLGQLRGFQLQEKERLNKLTDNTQVSLGLKSAPMSSSSSALNLPPLPPLPALPSSIISTSSSSSASSVANSVMSTPTYASPSPGVAISGLNAAPSLLDSLNTSSTAPSSTSSGSYQRSLEEQNRLLKDQLAQAHSTIKGMKQPKVKKVDTSSAASSKTASNAIATAPSTSGMDLGPAPSFTRTAGSTANNLASSNPFPSNPVPSNPFPASTVPTTAANAGTVRFELEGVVPSRSQIKLKVVLKNDRDMPLALPSNITASIRMPGRPEQIAKVEFDKKQIDARGEVHGIIRVPGPDLNATADVLLPNFLPPSEQFRDVHLTVPISKI
ncbi:MAG: hypothetical protein IAF58_20925 [Leptolyngbya sp.]|nr:hypothetical protein [Candidatus Melainabacteria bacterium]